jgi:hypothetical protein
LWIDVGSWKLDPGYRNPDAIRNTASRFDGNDFILKARVFHIKKPASRIQHPVLKGAFI